MNGRKAEKARMRLPIAGKSEGGDIQGQDEGPPGKIVSIRKGVSGNLSGTEDEDSQEGEPEENSRTARKLKPGEKVEIERLDTDSSNGESKGLSPEGEELLRRLINDE